MKDKEKTDLILKALKQYYTTWGRGRTNIIFPELRLGSGYCGVAQRRIDMFLISSNAGNQTTAFEIKVSRQDFKHDLESDLKQRGARLYSNLFYYVTPKGLLKPEEIPLWAGLMEINLDKYLETQDPKFEERVPSPLHAKAMPSWGLICSMVRHINKETGIDHVQMTNLKDTNYKLKEENKVQKQLLQDIANVWTEDQDQFIFWRLNKYKKGN